MSKMSRKRLIIKLMHREIKRLHKENKQLHDKHWSECRQIALYDEEMRVLRTENAELKWLLYVVSVNHLKSPYIVLRGEK
jgi:hypothetical protein